MLVAPPNWVVRPSSTARPRVDGLDPRSDGDSASSLTTIDPNVGKRLLDAHFDLDARVGNERVDVDGAEDPQAVEAALVLGDVLEPVGLADLRRELARDDVLARIGSPTTRTRVTVEGSSSA